MTAINNKPPVETCILLAGGLGTRLRSAVPDKPKCLAPIGQRTFLELQISSLASRGVHTFVLSLGYLAEMVVQALVQFEHYGNISIVQEDQPLGTGGAVLHAMQTMSLDEALIANGDTFLEANLEGMLAPLNLEQGEYMRVAAVTVANRERYGGMKITAGNSPRVEGFYEKGLSGPGPINAGLYHVNRRAFANHVGSQYFSLETQIMPQLAVQGRLSACNLSGSFIDIGVPEDYYKFCKKYE